MVVRTSILSQSLSDKAQRQHSSTSLARQLTQTRRVRNSGLICSARIFLSLCPGRAPCPQPKETAAQRRLAPSTQRPARALGPAPARAGRAELGGRWEQHQTFINTQDLFLLYLSYEIQICRKHTIFPHTKFLTNSGKIVERRNTC